MKTINLNPECIGRMSVGIKTPIIRTGDDLQEIVINSCLRAVGGFHEKAAIGITEAVVAISQGNYATPEDIQEDIARKYPGASEIMLLFPIQSRNRFMNIPKAIAAMDQIKKIYIVLEYPCDEVGNRLISEEDILNSGINQHEDLFTVKEFYDRFGEPKHIFTGKNYIKEFQDACQGKAEVIMCNDLAAVADYCSNVLVCTIRKEQRDLHKRTLKKYGVKTIFDLSEILNESVNGSGYSPEYGLLGSNMMAGGNLKLMPRGCQELVESIQQRIFTEYGAHVDVMVYGDGAFKDPVGGIWELADPETTLGATKGLRGTPKEVKLKYLASKYPNKNQEELNEIIAKEREKRQNTEELSGEASLGTTPRQLTDLFASWADLTTGSGDECTPVVYSIGFLK